MARKTPMMKRTPKGLDEVLRADWAQFVRRLYESPAGENFVLSPVEKDLLILRLKRTVDIGPIVEALGAVMYETLLNWRDETHVKK